MTQQNEHDIMGIMTKYGNVPCPFTMKVIWHEINPKTGEKKEFTYRGDRNGADTHKDMLKYLLVTLSRLGHFMHYAEISDNTVPGMDSNNKQIRKSKIMATFEKNMITFERFDEYGKAIIKKLNIPVL